MEKVKKRGSGKSGTYRRYQGGTHPIYDREYNHYRVQSSILNVGMRSVFDIGRFSSIQSIETEIYLLVGLGDKLGKIEVGKVETYAAIPKIQRRLKKLKSRFNDRKESMLLSGYSIEEIKETKEAEAERLINEAHLDVRLAELEHLEKMLGVLNDKEEEEKASNVLINGPMFTRSGNPPRIVDGQNVGSVKDKKGNVFLVIDDVRSPYHGMSLTDYRKLCKDWLLQQVNRKTALEKARQVELREKGYSDIRVPMAGSKPRKDSLPAWPDDVVNHLKE